MEEGGNGMVGERESGGLGECRGMFVLGGCEVKGGGRIGGVE